MQNNKVQKTDNEKSQEVQRPAWTIWILITWIAATAAIYYYNFTQSFYHENQSSIQTLIDRLF
ncbi:MAG: hypothetical protein VCB26_00290 [Candidatus Hydrogenedentota bacterium]